MEESFDVGITSCMLTKGKKVKNNKSTHEWSVYVRPPDGEGSFKFVEKVIFTLHETFKDPVRGTHACVLMLSPPLYLSLYMLYVMYTHSCAHAHAHPPAPTHSLTHTNAHAPTYTRTPSPFTRAFLYSCNTVITKPPYVVKSEGWGEVGDYRAGGVQVRAGGVGGDTATSHTHNPQTAPTHLHTYAPAGTHTPTQPTRAHWWCLSTRAGGVGGDTIEDPYTQPIRYTH